MSDQTAGHREARRPDAEHRPEDHPNEPGAEGGSDSARDAKAPFAPHEDDDSPLGDTDQHSTA